MTVQLNRYTLEATIPTVQFGNVRPTLDFTVETEAEVKEAYELAVNHFVNISKDIGETEMKRKELKN